MKTLKEYFRKRKLQKIIKKIDSLCADISVNYNANIAFDIRIILTELDKYLK